VQGFAFLATITTGGLKHIDEKLFGRCMRCRSVCMRSFRAKCVRISELA
jgi:hypothetical protein